MMTLRDYGIAVRNASSPAKYLKVVSWITKYFNSTPYWSQADTDDIENAKKDIINHLRNVPDTALASQDAWESYDRTTAFKLIDQTAKKFEPQYEPVN